MKILAVDTALAACSAAVYDGEVQRVLAAGFSPMATGQAEAIGPMVRGVMEKAGMEFSGLHRVAATIGPGTFTGLRIGLAFARGLGLALGLPVVGITTLKAIAANVASNPRALPIAVLIDARRGNVYSQVFSARLDPLNEPLAHSLQEAAARLPAGESWAIGSGAGLLADTGDDYSVRRSHASDLPHASVVAALAACEAAPAAPPAPLYLRPPNAKPLPPRSVTIDIHKVSIDQAESLGNLHALSFDHPWDAASIRKLMAVPGALALVAMSRFGEPLGFVLARATADEAEILTLAVAPDFRRRRIGLRLLAGAADALAAEGARRLHIEVARSNIPAMSLYEAAGFAVNGTRRDYYARPNGTREDAVAMSRALPIANHGV
jgi:tRNA threonylcarbamoyladenosine biosynthesis protein TsaB